jgi:hypothetical protein
MKSTLLALAIVLAAWPTFGQQGSTTTECEKTTAGITCKTAPTPPTSVEALAEIFSRKKNTNEPQPAATSTPTALSPEAVKAFLADQKAAQDAKETVDFVYCRQNPNGSVTEYQGKPRTCTDVVEYTKAFCVVNATVDRCKLAKSKAEVEKAFASAIEDFKNDPRHTKRDTQGFYDEFFGKMTRWGCMSFPDMILPQRDGTEYRCPYAPETPPAHSGTISQKK